MSLENSDVAMKAANESTEAASQDDSVMILSPTVESKPSESTVTDTKEPEAPTPKDISALIASRAVAEEAIGKPSTPLHRKAPAAKTPVVGNKDDKDIRRNSKGFENFDDYFDEESGSANTTAVSQEDEDNDTSMMSEPVQEEDKSEDEIPKKESTTAEPKSEKPEADPKSNSKEADEKPSEPKTKSENQETIDDIQNFIQDTSADSGSNKEEKTPQRKRRRSGELVSPPAAKVEVVKEGKDEYVVLPSGKDTGLSGKYWSDLGNLGSRRRCTMTPPEKKPAPDPTEKKKRTPQKSADGTPASSSAARGGRGRGRGGRGGSKGLPRSPGSVKSEGGAKKELARDNGSKEASNLSVTNGVALPTNRSVSCLADAKDSNTQGEIDVECVASYKDMRWVNIGKERDGMLPDSVQYARALRPPYHLLSFLRVKAHSTKGMSCTDKNTMVFVVLKGDINVLLHKTDFHVNTGDSFYIPPKNYYNLINKTDTDTELCLIQFQYDGPITPTATPASGSTSTKPAASSTSTASSEESDSKVKITSDQKPTVNTANNSHS